MVKGRLLSVPFLFCATQNLTAKLARLGQGVVYSLFNPNTAHFEADIANYLCRAIKKQTGVASIWATKVQLLEITMLAIEVSLASFGKASF